VSTGDGGSTWSAQYPGTALLTDVSCAPTDARYCWAVGALGEIIAKGPDKTPVGALP
jgi:hypothetical protein